MKTQCIKIKTWQNDNHVSTNHMEAGTIIFISEKLDSRANNVTRARQGHLIMINELTIKSSL